MNIKDPHQQSPDRTTADARAANVDPASAALQAVDLRRAWMPPPLPFLIGLALGWGVDAWRPWAIAEDLYVLIAMIVIGVLAAVGGTALIIGSGRALVRHGTSEDTEVETTALVETGPFAFSRNPIYLALALLHIAIACFANNAWMLLMLAPASIAVDRIVVVGEERYLTMRFGRSYTDYLSRVRRWL